MFEPLITFYTPTYRRPRALESNIAVVRAQSVARAEHVIVPDLIGVGIAGMFQAIADNLDKLNGKYVYIYQDDDLIYRDDAVEEFGRFVRAQGFPAVVICKNIKGGRLLPDRWGQAPELGHIDLGSYIVRRDVFNQYAHRFGARYEGDFDFIRALWEDGVPFSWWDFVFCEATQVGKGRAE